MTAFGDFNLYEELEIIKESTPEEIKKAYKKLAMVKSNQFYLFINRNGILIKIRTIQMPQKNFKEFHMPIQYYLMLKREDIMINMEKLMRIIGILMNL